MAEHELLPSSRSPAPKSASSLEILMQRRKEKRAKVTERTTVTNEAGVNNGASVDMGTDRSGLQHANNHLDTASKMRRDTNRVEADRQTTILRGKFEIVPVHLHAKPSPVSHAYYNLKYSTASRYISSLTSSPPDSIEQKMAFRDYKFVQRQGNNLDSNHALLFSASSESFNEFANRQHRTRKPISDSESSAVDSSSDKVSRVTPKLASNIRSNTIPHDPGGIIHDYESPNIYPRFSLSPSHRSKRVAQNSRPYQNGTTPVRSNALRRNSYLAAQGRISTNTAPKSYSNGGKTRNLHSIRNLMRPSRLPPPKPPSQTLVSAIKRSKARSSRSAEHSDSFAHNSSSIIDERSTLSSELAMSQFLSSQHFQATSSSVDLSFSTESPTQIPLTAAIHSESSSPHSRNTPAKLGKARKNTDEQKRVDKTSLNPSVLETSEQHTHQPSAPTTHQVSLIGAQQHLPPTEMFLFWDYENCKPPKSAKVDMYKFATALTESFLREFQRLGGDQNDRQICNCYFSRGEKNHLPDKEWKHLDQAGWRIVPVMNKKQKPERVDFEIIRDMNRLILSSKPAFVGLISGDGDFATKLSELERMGHSVAVLGPSRAGQALRQFSQVGRFPEIALNDVTSEFQPMETSKADGIMFHPKSKPEMASNHQQIMKGNRRNKNKKKSKSKSKSKSKNMNKKNNKKQLQQQQEKKEKEKLSEPIPRKKTHNQSMNNVENGLQKLDQLSTQSEGTVNDRAGKSFTEYEPRRSEGFQNTLSTSSKDSGANQSPDAIFAKLMGMVPSHLQNIVAYDPHQNRKQNNHSSTDESELRVEYLTKAEKLTPSSEDDNTLQTHSPHGEPSKSKLSLFDLQNEHQRTISDAMTHSKIHPNEIEVEKPFNGSRWQYDATLQAIHRLRVLGSSQSNTKDLSNIELNASLSEASHANARNEIQNAGSAETSHDSNAKSTIYPSNVLPAETRIETSIVKKNGSGLFNTLALSISRIKRQRQHRHLLKTKASAEGDTSLVTMNTRPEVSIFQEDNGHALQESDGSTTIRSEQEDTVQEAEDAVSSLKDKEMHQEASNHVDFYEQGEGTAQRSNENADGLIIAEENSKGESVKFLDGGLKKQLPIAAEIRRLEIDEEAEETRATEAEETILIAAAIEKLDQEAAMHGVEESLKESNSSAKHNSQDTVSSVTLTIEQGRDNNKEKGEVTANKDSVMNPADLLDDDEETRSLIAAEIRRLEMEKEAEKMRAAEEEEAALIAAAIERLDQEAAMHGVENSKTESNVNETKISEETVIMSNTKLKKPGVPILDTRRNTQEELNTVFGQLKSTTIQHEGDNNDKGEVTANKVSVVEPADLLDDDEETQSLIAAEIRRLEMEKEAEETRAAEEEEAALIAAAIERLDQEVAMHGVEDREKGSNSTGLNGKVQIISDEINMPMDINESEAPLNVDDIEYIEAIIFEEDVKALVDERLEMAMNEEEPLEKTKPHHNPEVESEAQRRLSIVLGAGVGVGAGAVPSQHGRTADDFFEAEEHLNI